MRCADAVWLCLASLLCLGCGGRPSSPLPTLLLDNGRLLLEFVDPSSPQDPAQTGCRFLHAGWLRGVTVKGRGGNFLKRDSIHHRIPLFGLPFEFHPGPHFDIDPEDGEVTCLQYGVGIVRHEAGNRFEARPLRLFPWSCALDRRPDGGFVIAARQQSGRCNGYAYELELRISASWRSNALVYDFAMRNVGEKAIDTEVYAHPFLDAAGGFGDAWFRMPGDTARRRVRDFPGETQFTPAGQADDDAWRVETGDFGTAGGRMAICGDRPLRKVVLWHYGADCIALEPFVRIAIPPGGAAHWRFTITFSAGEEVTEEAEEAMDNAAGN